MSAAAQWRGKMSISRVFDCSTARNSCIYTRLATGNSYVYSAVYYVQEVCFSLAIQVYVAMGGWLLIDRMDAFGAWKQHQLWENQFW